MEQLLNTPKKIFKTTQSTIALSIRECFSETRVIIIQAASAYAKKKNFLFLNCTALR